MNLPVISIGRKRSFPPRVTAHTERFWRSLENGQFETTECNDCGKKTFPPKPFCPHCWSKDLTWVPLGRFGRLYSQTVIHAAPAVFRSEAPYRVCIVDLDEGLRLATLLMADQPPVLDARLEIVALRYLDGPLFAARPLPHSSHLVSELLPPSSD